MLETRTLLSAVLTVDDGDATYAETGTAWAAGGLAGGQEGDYRTIAKPTSTAGTGEQIIDNTNSSAYSETGASWVTGGLAGGYQSNYRAIAPVGTSTGTYEVIQDENEASLTGPWGVGSLTGGYNGDYLWCDPTGPSGSATYTFSNVPTGSYDVYARWVPHANRSAAAPYTISVVGGNGAIITNQSGSMTQTTGGFSWTKISFSTLNISGASQSVSIRLDSTTSGYVIADGIRLAGTRTAQPGTAAWNFSGLAAGTYEVATTWSSHANRASNAPFTVTTAAETKTASIDLRVSPSGITAAGTSWKSLAQVTVAANGSINVSTTNVGANGYVIADAIRIVRLSATGTATWTFEDLEPGTYTAYASWVPHSNRATNATYTLQGTPKSKTVSQQNTPAADGWSPLFTFTTTDITSQTVALENAGADGFVIADAIKLNTVPTFDNTVNLGIDVKGNPLPSIPKGSSLDVYIELENPEGDMIAQLIGVDPDPGHQPQLQFDITGGNAEGVFAINLQTGIITQVTTPSAFKYVLTVSVADPAGDSSSMTLTINVLSAVPYIRAAGDANLAAMNDVKQQNTLNCFLMAGIAEMARRTPAIVESLINKESDNTFKVKVWKNGVQKDVIVPAFSKSEFNRGQMIGDRDNQTGQVEVWPWILDRAYTIANGEPTGNPALVWGKFADTGVFVYVSGVQSMSLDDAKQRLQNNEYMVMGTKADGYQDLQPESYKLVTEHSYIVMNIDANDKVHFWNPWQELHPDPVPFAQLDQYFEGWFVGANPK